MSIPSYPMTKTESVVEKLLNRIGIHSYPIDLDQIAKYLQIRWTFLETDSVCDLKQKRIIIDNRLDWLDQRADFAHEIAHIILHCGSQLILHELFIDLQERQANHFALFLLVPSHFLFPLIEHSRLNTEDEYIGLIAQSFHVTYAFAKRRFQKFLSQIQAEKQNTRLMHKSLAIPQFGRDYDNSLVIGNTEYFYRNGGVVFSRRLAEV